jgi:hypothetical protein
VQVILYPVQLSKQVVVQTQTVQVLVTLVVAVALVRVPVELLSLLADQAAADPHVSQVVVAELLDMQETVDLGQ